MVRFNTGDTVGMSDVPDKSSLAERIEKVFNQCAKQNRGENLELREIYVFGSYARDEAKKGTSDIDVTLVIATPGEELMNAKDDVALNEVVDCVQQSADAIISGHMEWFDDIDITHTKQRNKWMTLFRKSTSTRIDGEPDKAGVYDLWRQGFVTREEVGRELRHHDFNKPEVR